MYNNLLSPMHIACINPDIELFKMFFKAYPNIRLLDNEQRDLVHYAAANSNPDILKILIEKKAEVNERDVNKTTPLMIACKLGRLQNVQQFLECQEERLKKLNPKDVDYEFQKDFNRYVNTLGKKKKTALHIAAKHGHSKIVERLIEHGANIDAKNSKMETPLCLAAKKGHYKVCEVLINAKANIHGLNRQLKSPIILAATNGHIHIVSLLLRKGVNVNFSDVSYNTILHYAAGYGWLNICKFLVNAEADINAQNEWKYNPLMIAVLKGHLGIVEYFLSLKEIDGKFTNEDG